MQEFFDSKIYNTKDDAIANDPRFQRRVVSIEYPIPFISNMINPKLECGHAPLCVGDQAEALKIGDLCFCPYCAQ